MNELFIKVESGAYFSEDRKYRYALWRTWDTEKPFVMFIGLNPSTADESQNDPTIKKVIKIAAKNGYGGVYMLNLYPFISTDPNKLDDNSPEFANATWIWATSQRCKDVVFAWGNFKQARIRAEKYKKKFPNALCLHINKNGSPKHPLYCRDDSKLIPYKYGRNK